MKLNTFEEIYRIVESISLRDIKSEHKKYFEAFQIDAKYMRDNINKLDPGRIIEIITHMAGHLDFLTNTEEIFDDKDDPERKKLQQIYFLMTTKMGEFV
jgi:hypothetical protein